MQREERRAHFPKPSVISVRGVDTFLVDAGRGPPIVLLHGLGATNASFLPTLHELSRDYRVIAPDLPGFGDSAKPLRAYHATFFAKWAKALLDALGIERAHFIGNSMGGRVALEVALRLIRSASNRLALWLQRLLSANCASSCRSFECSGPSCGVYRWSCRAQASSRGHAACLRVRAGSRLPGIKPPRTSFCACLPCPAAESPFSPRRARCTSTSRLVVAASGRVSKARASCPLRVGSIAISRAFGLCAARGDAVCGGKIGDFAELPDTSAGRAARNHAPPRA